MSKQSAKAGVFPAIPSQENLDQTHDMRQRQQSRRSRLRTVISGALGLGADRGSLSLRMSLDHQDHAQSREIREAALDDAPEEKLAAFESTLREFEEDGAEPAPVRFPYKG